LRIERVDPDQFAGRASRVLQGSWRPPCLRYSEPYLRWEFGFPGASTALGVAALDGEEPVGFVAVMPRRLRLGRSSIDAHLMSFGAMRPDYRGPLSVPLYRTLILEVRESARPIVAFTEPGGVAERVLLASMKAAGYRHRPLGSCRTYAALARPDATPPPAVAEEADDPAEFLAALGRCADPRTLWSDPDRRQL
jgi:hypothetical protein